MASEAQALWQKLDRPPKPEDFARYADEFERRCKAAETLIGGLIHHSDRGSQYVSIKYTERLADAGIEPSVGSVGDSRACPRA